MVDFTRTVEIVFGGRSDVSRVTRAVENDLSRLEGGLSSLARPLASTTNAILAIDAAILAAGAGILAFSINQAVQFESALLDLQRVLSDSDGEASDYADTIESMALRFGTSATTVTQSLADFRQAGFGIGDSIALVEGSLTALAVSEVSAEQATTILTSTIRGFGLEADDVTRILDVLNSTSNNFGASFNEIGDAVSSVSAVARLAGLSLEETAGFLTPIIENGIAGTEAANGLRTVLIRLVSDTAPVIGALDALGISQNDLNGDLRSGRDILFDVAEAFQQLTPEQQLYNAGQLAGINRATTFALSVGNFNRVLEVTQEVTNSAGSAQTELQIRLDSTQVSLDRVRVGFNLAATSIGTNFLPQTRGVADASTDILLAFSEIISSGGLAPFFDALSPSLDSFEDDLRSIAENLPEAFAGLDFDGLIDSFGDLAGQFSDLFGGVDLTTADGLTQALQAIINSGESLVRITGGIVESFQPLFSALSQGGEGINGLSEETQNAIGNVLGFGRQLDTLLPIVSSVISAVGGLITAIAALTFIRAIGTVSSLTSGLGSLLSILGRGGVVGAIVALVLLIGEWTGVNDAVITSISNLVGRLNGTTDAIARNEQATRQSVEAYEEQLAAFQQISDASERLLQTTIDSRSAEFDRTDIANSLTQAFRDQGIEYNALTGVVGEVDQAQNNAAQSSQRWIEILVDGVPTFRQIGAAASESFGQAAESAIEATEASEEFQTRLEEIASNERIANIEAMVTINVAQLEQQTRLVEASFESINATVQNTGNLIGGLFGDLNDADRPQELAIERQIEAENRRRDEALSLQERLINSTIELNRQRSNAIQRGDSLINISADGLEPELEAFMFRILERIQIRVSEEQADLLLGIDAATPQVAA